MKNFYNSIPLRISIFQFIFTIATVVISLDLVINLKYCLKIFFFFTKTSSNRFIFPTVQYCKLIYDFLMYKYIGFLEPGNNARCVSNTKGLEFH